MPGIERTTFGQRLRQARIDAGLSQAEVGKKLGLCQSGYMYYETGRNKNITRERIFKLSQLLECTAEHLLGGNYLILERYPTDIQEFLASEESKPYIERAYEEYKLAKGRRP